MENEKLLRKWKPILDSILGIFNLENNVLLHIAKWMENKVRDSNSDNDIAKVLKEYHDELIKSGDKLNVVDVYYSKMINKIVYELENGQVLYVDEKTYKLPNNKVINEKINLFDKVKY